MLSGVPKGRGSGPRSHPGSYCAAVKKHCYRVREAQEEGMGWRGGGGALRDCGSRKGLGLLLAKAP